jgi:hypothetical protein
MRCSRCGETAVVQREGGYFCGRCALTRDWEEIVRLVQELGSGGPAAPGGPPAAAPAAPPQPQAAPTPAAGAQLPPADPFG